MRHIKRPNRLNQDFLAAFAAFGAYPACADLTGLTPEGYGLRQGTIRNGRRDSTANAFLRPALSRPNLKLITDAPTTRILVGNGVATGVEILAAGGRQQLRATHEVLLCVQTATNLADPGRFKFEGTEHYLKSAAEMRALWDTQIPGACDSTLLIADRVQSYSDVWEQRDRMPVVLGDVWRERRNQRYERTDFVTMRHALRAAQHVHDVLGAGRTGDQP